jgi:hypothetical protein
VDVPEIGFEALARQMGQRDERFLTLASMRAEVALYLCVPSTIAVFVAEPPEELGGGVPLLGRRGLVIDQDLVDDRLDWPPTPERIDPWSPAGGSARLA